MSDPVLTRRAAIAAVLMAAAAAGGQAMVPTKRTGAAARTVQAGRPGAVEFREAGTSTTARPEASSIRRPKRC